MFIPHQDKARYAEIFQAYKHSLPVIFSSLNGQYPGSLFVEKEGDTILALLTTPFCFHFVAGDIKMPDAAKRLHDILFNQYLRDTQQPEAIVFCPDETWYGLLEEVFERHHGVKDVRKRFGIKKDSFEAAVSRLKEPDGIQTILTEEQDFGSAIPYPVCRIMKDGACVSFCSGFMLGSNHAELDVGTEEGHRGKGYAKWAAATLIAELLRRGMEPDWCTWPYRVESQALGKVLGFEPLSDVMAYIWSENDCGKLE